MPPAFRLLLLVPALAGAGAAQAAERAYSVTSFDRIAVEGPYQVLFQTGPQASARASGSAAALDRLTISVEDNMLRIRPSQSGWGGWPGADQGKVTVLVRGPGLRRAALSGSGTLAIDRMRGEEARLALTGSGELSVAAVQATRVALSVSGSGTLTAAGKALQARAMLTGSGEIRAGGLAAAEAEVTTVGSGDVAMSASRTARVNLTGSGDVAVAGRARCQVTRTGSGDVRCGG